MRKALSVVILGLALVASSQLLNAQQSGPWWAYGFLAPPAPGQAAPECASPLPVNCARPRPQAVLDETPASLPGAPRQFSRKQAGDWFAPADWYPGDHPAVPDIVAHGNEKNGVRACALCHVQNGTGRPENAELAGLPVDYFMQAMNEFKSGTRRSADPRKVNTQEMIGMAKALSEEETRAAAEYFASLTWGSRIAKVVEGNTVPRVRETPLGMFLPAEGGGTQPLGQRIIETPEHPETAEQLRDPRGKWIVYAPPGSIAKGASLVTTGAALVDGGKTIPGRTMACGICHGADLKGVGSAPGIGGRSPSYVVRQLHDIQQGTRDSALMKAVAENLTEDDFIAIGAYIASRAVP